MLFGWAVTVVLGIFAYTVMADSPALGATRWQDVASVTTGWWLTAFGGTLHFDGISISLPPLLITLLTYLAAVALLRKLPVRDWRDVLILASASGGTAAGLGLFAPVGSSWWPAGLGGAAISLLAVLTSKNRSDWFGTGFFTSAAGRALYDGFILARRAILAALALGTAALGAAVIAGWPEILSITDFYIVGWESMAMMWLFQAAYLPVYIIWALAYIIGAGFSVGAGTVFSALGVTSAPLPAIPILGALPQPGGGSPWLLVLVIAVLVGLGARHARAFPDLAEVLVTGAIHVGAVAVMGSALAVLSEGAAGPDRLSVMGAEAPRMALMSALVIGLPLLLGIIAGHRTSVAAYRRWFASAREAAAGLAARRTGHSARPDEGDDRAAEPVTAHTAPDSTEE